MAKIYVSSTFNDLEEHRKKASLAIRRAGHEDAAMEYYVAEDQRPVDRCLADVAQCDLYIGIFAWRYGWIPKKNNRKKLSITEMEYRQAVKTGKTCLIFLLDGKAPWPGDLIDDDRTSIRRLRDELAEKHGGDRFSSADELGRIVAEALHKWEKEAGIAPPPARIAQLDLEAYFQAVSKRYLHLELEGLTQPHREEFLQMQLNNIFVEQSVREDRPPIELTKEAWDRLRHEREVHDGDLPPREFGLTADDLRRTREVYFEKPTRAVLDVIADSRHRLSVILGDPGSGKSTLTRYALLSLIGPSHVTEADEKLRRAFPDHLPLLIELRSFAAFRAEGRCDTFLGYLEYLGKTEGWALTRDALHSHLKNDGRAVVLFDGLDEIFDPRDREIIARQINGFALDYSKVRIIATSRIVGFPQKILETGGFTVFTLQDLDQGQVEQFVDRWYSLALPDRPDDARARRERILTSFANSPSIRQLAGNPMLLTIMAIIGRHQELPRDRWKLYDFAASILIERWDVNRHLRDQKLIAAGADFIGEDEKKELLRRLAYRMQSGEGGLAGNFIHNAQLETEFESYLKDRFGKSPAEATRIAREMIRQFRERNFILCFRGANTYGFVHRAFLEFFCASSFVFKFKETQELSIDDLKELVFGVHWEQKEWREVLRLICGMIHERFVGELVDSLLSIPNQPRYYEYDRRPPWNIALAVQCLAELKNLDQILPTAERTLRAICTLLDAAGARQFHEEGLNDLGIHNNLDPFFDFLTKEVVNIVKEIESEWPQCDWFLDWLRNGIWLDRLWRNGESIGGMIGSIGMNSDDLYKVVARNAVHRDWPNRYVMVYALASGWKSKKESLEWLRNLAVNDPDEGPRLAALTAIANQFRDHDGSLQLLRERAVNDESPTANEEYQHRRNYPRQLAIETISRQWPHHPDTLPLLLDRAEHDPTPWLRERAKVLAELIKAAGR